LPPAPAWEGATAPLVLATHEGGSIRAEWAAVKDAKSYRVEIARDDTFRDLIAREEVGAAVRSFRADKMSPGRYFVAVRAIDTDEYLGVAAKRTVDVVELDIGVKNAVFTGSEVVANPYAAIAFKTGFKTELAIDDGPFGPIPAVLDLTKRAPAKMRFRPQGAEAPYDVTVRYTEVSRAGHGDAREGRQDGGNRGDLPRPRRHRHPRSRRARPPLRTPAPRPRTSALVAQGRPLARDRARARARRLAPRRRPRRDAARILGTGNVAPPKPAATRARHARSTVEAHKVPRDRPDHRGVAAVPRSPASPSGARRRTQRRERRRVRRRSATPAPDSACRAARAGGVRSHRRRRGPPLAPVVGDVNGAGDSAARRRRLARRAVARVFRIGDAALEGGVSMRGSASP
jgi:hypothetical protein